MSMNVDQRVVQMKFDNAQFEKGAQTSLSTLDKLKSSLNFDKASSGLEKVKDSFKGFSVASVSDGVDTLKVKFDALGIAGITVVQNLTNALMNGLGGALHKTIGLITSGGMRRAQNLEQAKFSLQGLLYTTDDAGKQIEKFGISVEDVMGPNGPVQAAVSGTAYGLDEAAKSASNFIASGITDMGDLEDALKSISGTAAQTGSSYEDIARIYQKVAGQGRVMGDDLNSIATRGVNASAAIADYLNSLGGNFDGFSEQFFAAAKKVGKTTDFTEADIRDMVSAGGIQFDVFAKSMYSAFGENAFKANETFSGALSNMKAALSRFGEKFATPYLQNMRDIFNALRPAINAVSAALDPLVNLINKYLTSGKEVFVGWIDGFTKMAETFKSGFKQPWEDVKKMGKGLNVYSDGFEDAIDNTKVITNIADRLDGVISNLLTSLTNFGSGVKALFVPITDTINRFATKIDALGIIEDLAKKIKNASDRFKEFSENSETAKKIGEAFTPIVRGIGIAFSLIKTGASGAWTVIKDLSSALSPLGEAFLVIGRRLATFSTSILGIIKNSRLIEGIFKTISQVVNGVLKPVIEWVAEQLKSFGKMSGVLGTIRNAFSKFAFSIGEWLNSEKDFSSVGEGIVSVLNNIKKYAVGALNSFSGALRKLKAPLSKASEGLGGLYSTIKNWLSSIDILSKIRSAFSKLGEVLEKIGSVISKVAGKIWEGMLQIGKSFTETFTFTDILKGGLGLNLFTAAGGLGGIFMTAKQFLKTTAGSLDTTMKGIQGLIKSLTGILGDGAEKKVGTIKEVAEALLILATAVTLMALVDTAKLLGAVGAMEVLFVELEEFLKTLSGLKGSEKTLRSISMSLLPMSVAVLIFAAALQKLSSIDYEGLIGGIVGFAGIMLMLTYYAKEVSKISKGGNGELVKTAGMMIGLAIAVDLLVIAVKKLGEADPQVLMQGLLGVAVLIGTLGLFTKFAQADKMGISSGAGILLMAASIAILVKVVEKIGSMPIETVKQGLAAMAGLLLEMGMFSAMMSEQKGVVKSAAALLVVAVAMNVLAKAIESIGSLSYETLVNGLTAIGVVLLEMTLALNLLPKHALSGSASLLVLSAAMLVLSASLKLLSTIDPTALAISLAGLGAALAIMLIAAKAATKVAPGILILAGAMALFGIGIAALSVGVAGLSVSLVAFTTAFVASLGILSSGLIELGPQLAQGLVVLLEAALNALTQTATLIFETVNVLITGLIDTICQVLQATLPTIMETISILLIALVETGCTVLEETIPRILETIGVLIESVLQFLVTYIPMIAEAGMQMLLGLLTAISDNIQQVVETALQIVENFINGIAEGLPGIIDAGFNLLLSFINGIANAVREHSYEMGEAAWNLVSALIEGFVKAIAGFFNNPVQKIKELGQAIVKGLGDKVNASEFGKKVKDAIEGLKKGIGDKIESAKSKIKELADAVKKKLGDILSIEKIKEIGGNIIDGIKQGLSDKWNSALEKVANLGKALLGKIKGILGINSPSTAFKEIGTNCLTGMENGLGEDTNVLQKVTTLGSKLLKKLKDAFSKDKVSETTSDLVSNVESGLDSGSSTLTSKSDSIGSSIVSSLNNKRSSMYSAGSNLMAGLKEGLESKEDEVYNKINTISNEIIKITNRVEQISSPSRVFKRIGEYCMEGLAIGLSDTSDVNKATVSMASSLSDAFTDITESDIDPTIRPVLDLSEIQNGVSRIDGMLSDSPLLSSYIAGNMDMPSKHQENSLNSINDILNKILQTINEEDDILTTKIGDMLSNTQVVLDSGALVGNIAMGVDNALGRISINRSRGVV